MKDGTCDNNVLRLTCTIHTGTLKFMLHVGGLEEDNIYKLF